MERLLFTTELSLRGHGDVLDGDARDLAWLLHGRLRDASASANVGASEGRYAATGTCALLEPPESGRDSLVVHLDHEDGTSLVVIIPFDVSGDRRSGAFD